MNISIIIPVYKDLISLGLVLEALRRQTYKEFEIIIAEDDDSIDTVQFLQDYKDLNILHISQPDTGRNKIIIQNKAILQASGEYLFFIDGDIVPFKHFIEYSLVLAKQKRVLSGRRVNLGETDTRLIKENRLDIVSIEDNYFSFLLHNKKNRSVRAEQGIELNPNNFLYKLISLRKRNAEILGCNFSCFKEDIIAINGFDEGYGDSIIGQEDSDLSWRFRGIGVELYSSKNIVNCFHLWHPENGKRNIVQDKLDLKLMLQNQERKLFRCLKGLYS